MNPYKKHPRTWDETCLTPDHYKERLKKHMAQTQENLSSFLDSHGICLPVLDKAMERFLHSLVALPEGAACKSGCAYCCHLRVGVSIPEVVVLFNELKSQATPKGLAVLGQRVRQTAEKGNILDESFWHNTRTPCPFLDTEGQNLCLIYALRPFTCRAYHSTDQKSCRRGFEKGHMQIPCFPLYRTFTDMYSTVFIRVLAQKGLFSYQVGFVQALKILFENNTAIEQWLNGKDVFKAATLMP